MKEDELIKMVLAQYDVIRHDLQKILARLTSTKQILNVDDFCDYTGMSKATAYRLTGNALIKHFKPTGSLIYFKKVDIDNFLKQNPVLPMESIADSAIDFIALKSKKKLTKRKS